MTLADGTKMSLTSGIDLGEASAGEFTAHRTISDAAIRAAAEGAVARILQRDARSEFAVVAQDAELLGRARVHLARALANVSHTQTASAGQAFRFTFPDGTRIRLFTADRAHFAVGYGLDGAWCIGDIGNAMPDLVRPCLADRGGWLVETSAAWVATEVTYEVTCARYARYARISESR